MTIASSDIVFIVAEMGTGKTFTGDYLDSVYGFNHVDGDVPIRNLHIPKNKALVTGLIEYGKKFNVNPNEAPDELWQPYYQELVDNTLEAAKTSDKVALTFACNRQKHRDFVMKKLKEGGANNPKLVFLEMNRDIKLEGLYHRTVRQAEAVDMTITDMCRTFGWEGLGEISLEEYKKMIIELEAKGAVPSFDGPPSYAIIIDVSSRDVLQLDRVDEALGLQRDSNLLYEDIVGKVLSIDHKRDEETPYDADWYTELSKEIENKTEEERQQIKKRRSSLMTLARTLGSARLSDASSSSVGEEKLKARRQSLIMTGKIE